ncbi:MAG: hypothetical protein OEZ19_05840 [Paracoccaceae bacterium]|nr:hypothetical protein [Paracoccaceae bacterium]
MAQGKKILERVEGVGTALSGLVTRLFGSVSGDMREKVGLGLAVVLILGLGVLVNWLLYGDKEDGFVADFMETCVPGATQNYLTEGVDSDQAEAKAKTFCRCVGTTVSETIPQEVFAEVEETKKLTNALVLAIGMASRTCQ